MPRCKNDKSRYFKGTEPSPKGKGFCAHACKVHQRKKGTDGKMWTVVSHGGRKRWVRSEVLRKRKGTGQKKKSVSAKKKPRKKKSLRGGANHTLVDTILPALKTSPYLNLKIKRLFQDYIDRRYTDEKVSMVIVNTIQTLEALPEAKNPQSDIARYVNMFKTMQTQIRDEQKRQTKAQSATGLSVNPNIRTFHFRSANNGPAFSLSFDPNLTVKQLKAYIFEVKKLKAKRVIVESKILSDQTVFQSVHPENHPYTVLTF